MASQKSLAARKLLEERLGVPWERDQLAAAPETPTRTVRLDRMIFKASGFSANSILQLRGYSRTRDHRLTPRSPASFLFYERVVVFAGSGSIKEVRIEYGRRAQKLAACRVTVIPNDDTGLRAAHLWPLWDLFLDPELSEVELAFDFGFASGIDGAFVRNYGVFGKSRRRAVAHTHCWDAWGSRRGSKFVRSYFKANLGVHRLELQFHRRWLETHGINTPREFLRFVQTVPRHHLLFARLDLDRAKRQLERAGQTEDQVNDILMRLRDCIDGLLGQCAVLRNRGGLKNVRRLLVPLRANRLVREALRNWTASWPKAPRKLKP